MSHPMASSSSQPQTSSGQSSSSHQYVSQHSAPNASGGHHSSQHSSEGHHSGHSSRESVSSSRGSRHSSSSLTTGIIRTQTAWFQKKVHLRPVLRGCHLVTDELTKQIPELNEFQCGICHIHIMHTSASLAINENWDPDVREDMEMFLSRLIPETTPFRHSCEGPDDMPAHIKACFLGSSLTIPVSDGKLNLGTWQGVWLCEHRNRAGSRKVTVTITGALKPGA
ncbi:unnamed protein product [Oppiella nova]|uniref:Uncharacterized protein n=2 Tax=Oppiidae TaxID=229795 RepID=A0A7R9QVS6_9ACAR|nr:unnamed protein product [Oppiella nova]CAG2175799.1 unnamed protein product [Oppiella nova]